MRRRLLASTLAIALACVAILGVPLAILARHEVWTSARDRVREEAANLGTGLEDSLDTGRPINLARYERVLQGHRLIVRRAHGPTVVAGPVIDKPIVGRVAVADTVVTVQAPSGPTVTRARELTLLVAGLALAATLSAIGLAVWQARRITTPLDHLVQRADALGRGEFSAEPKVSGVPEIDRVSGVLERSAQQLGTFLDLQQQFASDAAHQLRTPLTSIGLHLEEIARVGHGDVPAEADDALAQVERLDAVITSLLARARGDSAAPEVLDLAQLAAEGCRPWERVLAQTGRQLVCDLSDNVLVLARREHVLGVLASLLDNAVEHGAGDVHVTVARAAERACLTVRDDGSGVPADLVPRIFDRQVSGRRGTGIGLALARSLAAAESGTLGLTPGCPAEFVLSLPAQAAPGGA